MDTKNGWNAYRRDDDISAVVNLFANDGRLDPASGDPQVGKTNIENFLTNEFTLSNNLEVYKTSRCTRDETKANLCYKFYYNKGTEQRTAIVNFNDQKLFQSVKISSSSIGRFLVFPKN